MQIRLFVCIFLASLTFSHSSFANSSTWVVTGTGGWSNPASWLSSNPKSFPQDAGDAVWFTLSTGSNGAATISVPVTVGALNIGANRGKISYEINASGDGVLRLDNGGAGAQINQTAGSAGDAINAPLVMSDNLTIANSATNILTIGANISGTDANRTLTLGANGSAGPDATGIVLNNNASITIDGTLVNAGSGSDGVHIGGTVNGSVSHVLQESATSPLDLEGGIVISSTGTIIANDGGAWLSVANVSGTGDVILQNNSAVDGSILLRAVTTQGRIVISGTGIGGVGINGGTGPGVSAIIQDSATSSFVTRGGSWELSGTATLVNNGGAQVQFLQATSGTGDLVISNNVPAAAINFNEAGINNTGRVINSGTGTGVVQFGPIGSAFGPQLSAVVQDSTTSALVLIDGGFSSQGFAGSYTIRSGTLQLFGAADISSASNIVVGDSVASGLISVLSASQLANGGTLTLGEHEFLCGHGIVSDGNILVTGTSGSGIAPGTAGTIGTLEIKSNLTATGGCTLKFLLGARGNGSKLIVDGQLTLNCTDHFNLVLGNNAGAHGQGSLAPGTYELITYGSLGGFAIPGDISNLFKIDGPPGYTYTVCDSGAKAGHIVLTVARK